jgi:hypothetical protein
MPPTEEQVIDPAPQPTRLPKASAAEGEDVELINPAQPYPTTRASHIVAAEAEEEEVEESNVVEIRQPKNVIRLLGGEPLTAPIPADE